VQFYRAPEDWPRDLGARRAPNAQRLTKVCGAGELMPLSCLRMGAQLAQIAFLSCSWAGGVLCVHAEIDGERPLYERSTMLHMYHCSSLKSRIKLVCGRSSLYERRQCTLLSCTQAANWIIFFYGSVSNISIVSFFLNSHQIFSCK
jgi:hypothetical protein